MHLFRGSKIHFEWILLIFLLNPCPRASAEENGMLSIHADTAGLPVWVDSVQIGQTPIDSFPISPGQYTVRVAHPDPWTWTAGDWQKSVTIKEKDCMCEVVRFQEPIWISSQPEHSQIYIRNRFAGVAPRTLLCPDSGMTLRFEKPGFQSKSLYIQPGQGPSVRVSMIPVSDPNIHKQDEPVFRSRKIVVTGLIFLTSGIAGYAFKHLAEKSYDRYLEASQPAGMDRHYKRAVLFDRISGGCYIVCEVHFGLALFFTVREARSL